MWVHQRVNVKIFRKSRFHSLIPQPVPSSQLISTHRQTAPTNAMKYRFSRSKACVANTECTIFFRLEYQENGLVERIMQTLMQDATCLLEHAKLPLTIWRFTVATATYLKNLLVLIFCLPKYSTPLQLWCQANHWKLYHCKQSR